jgi:hypothetical protein
MQQITIQFFQHSECMYGLGGKAGVIEAENSKEADFGEISFLAFKH